MRRVRFAAVLLSVVLVALGVPASAQVGGSISGTLTDSATGAAIPNEYVTANSPTGHGGAVSRSDGTYLIDGLPPGDYRLSAGNWAEASYSDYVLVYWPDATTYQDAGIVTVAADEHVTGIDLELELGGVVTGTVTDAWTGSTLGHSAVSISRREAGEWIGAMGYLVEGNGTYRIPGLSGEYRLEFYENEYQPLRLDPFVIGPGQELVIDISVTPASGTPFATIAGRVCETEDLAQGCLGADGTHGQTLGGIVVEARDAGGSVLGAAITDPWGWFEIDDLAPGDIAVSALPPPGMTLIEDVEYRLGPNEGAWDVELFVERLDVEYLLTSRAGPDQVHLDAEAQIDLELIVSVADPAVASFDVTNVAIAVRLPSGLDYDSHSGDGPFDPATGIWTVPALSLEDPAQMSIIVRPRSEGEFRAHAEIVSADWPDDSVTFGDGRGADHTSVEMAVSAPPAEPTADVAVIGGRVWLDRDENGSLGDGEVGLQAVTVIATRDDGLTVTATTTSGGTFELTRLRAGTYRLELDRTTLPHEVEPPAETLVVVLGAGTEFRDADFGCVEVGGGFPRWLMIGGVAVLGIAALIAWSVTRRLDRSSTGPSLPTGGGEDYRAGSTTRTEPLTGSTSTML